METVFIAARGSTYYLIQWGDENSNKANLLTGRDYLEKVASDAVPLYELNNFTK